MSDIGTWLRERGPEELGMPTWLTRSQAARWLGLSTRRVDQLRAEGRLEYERKASREVRIWGDSVRKLLEAGRDRG